MKCSGAARRFGDCLVVATRMVREVRPQRDATGGHWRSIEPTGETFIHCRTHDVEAYGPEQQVLAEMRDHMQGGA